MCTYAKRRVWFGKKNKKPVAGFFADSNIMLNDLS
jgi:hypothetical protein